MPLPLRWWPLSHGCFLENVLNRLNGRSKLGIPSLRTWFHISIFKSSFSNQVDCNCFFNLHFFLSICESLRMLILLYQLSLAVWPLVYMLFTGASITTHLPSMTTKQWGSFQIFLFATNLFPFGFISPDPSFWLFTFFTIWKWTTWIW